MPKPTSLIAVAYAAPVMPVALLLASVVVIQGIYATEYGVPLEAISGVLLLAGLFDAITDPTIGYYSDKEAARHSSRRRLVLAGAISFPVSAYFLFSPPLEPSVTYFLLCYLVFYFSATLFQIPHLAWGGEVVADAQERNKIFSYRTIANYAGFICFAVLPMLPLTKDASISPQTLELTVFFAAALMLPAIYYSFRIVPDRKFIHAQKPSERVLPAVLSLFGNRAFLFFFTGFTFYGLSTGIGWALIFLILNSYLDLPGTFAYLFLLHLLTACVCAGTTTSLVRRLDKRKGLLTAIAISALGYACWPIALARTEWTIAIVGLFMVIMAPASYLGALTSYSLLADIADYEKLRSGRDRSAMCFGFLNLGVKTTASLGASAAFAIVSLFGFDPTDIEYGIGIYIGLALTMGAAPVFLCLLAFVAVYPIRLDAKKHAIIIRRLSSQKGTPQ